MKEKRTEEILSLEFYKRAKKREKRREILKKKYERKFFGKLENENNLPMNHGQSKRNEVEGEFELSFS